jgi:SAM-dependent methyltransferase
VGLTLRELEDVIAVRRHLADRPRVLTIGRQALHLHRGEAAALAAQVPEHAAVLRGHASGDWADTVLRALLATDRVEHLDVSDYEGAAIVADIGRRLPAELEQRYDLVIDGGTLEHVFDVPTALANELRLLRTGGRLLLSTPANNLCGHGFWQLSPEVVFRALGPAAGARLHRVSLVEAAAPGVELQAFRRRWDVADPELAGRRVDVWSRTAAMLLAHAEKLAHLDEPFAHGVFQSDYARRWSAEPAGVPSRGLAQRLPPALRRQARAWRQRRAAALTNRRHFERAG